MKNKKVAALIVLISIVVIVSICKIVSRNGNILDRRQIIKEMTELEYDSSITELNKSHTDYATQVQANKEKLAQAISNESVPTSKNATVDEMVTNIGKILEAKTSDATATNEDILEGKTAYVNGEKITGIGTTKQNSNVLFLGFRNSSSNVQNAIPVLYYNDEYLSKNENSSFTVKKSCDVHINSISTYILGNSWGYVKVYINNTVVSSINGENPGSKNISQSLNIGDIIKIVAYSQNNGYSTQQMCYIFFEQ